MRRHPVVAVLIILMLLPAGLASDDMSQELFSAASVTMEVQLSGSVDLIPDTASAVVDYVSANFTFIPRDTDQQRVSGLVHTPTPRNDYSTHVVYRWDSPGNHLDYSLTATVLATEYLAPVKKEISFPLLDLPAEIQQYTEQTEMIDSESKTVQDKAAEFAEGESELYEAVFKVAEWVEQNVEYDLTTLTADATQSASWVLKNRYGVCDEITTLFIALLRSLGIPARYVSGLAYTNYQAKNDWGPHGWAEVYFPDVGWVPFDVTYSEFGYVDQTHIVLKRSLDSSEAAVRYEWLGNHVTLRPGELTTKATLKSSSGTSPPRVSLELVPYRNAVGFGSSNLIEARATNMRDRTLVADIHLTPVVGMETDDPMVRYLLLSPGETKSAFWTVTAESEQRPGYYYTYPLSLKSGSAIVEDSFTEKDSAQFLSLEQVKAAREAKEAGEEKTYTREVQLDCLSSPEHPYIDQEPGLACTLRNAGNTVLKALEMCLASECETVDLGIAKSHRMVLSLSSYEAGQQFIDVKVSHPLVSRLKTVEVGLLDTPAVVFAGLTVPAAVQYGETFIINLTLQRTSISVPEDISVSLLGQEVITTESIEVEQQHLITVDSLLLRPGSNVLPLGVEFQDALNRSYSIERSIAVSVEGAPLLVRLDAFIADILDWLSGILG